MITFYSSRFGMDVVVTDHAAKSMEKRNVSATDLQEVLEEGDIKYKSDVQLWVFKHFQRRTDNLLCAAIVLEKVLVVKTVMINWELEDDL